VFLTPHLNTGTFLTLLASAEDLVTISTFTQSNRGEVPKGSFFNPFLRPA